MAKKEEREYQNKIVNTVVNSDLDICITVPTGGGKTFIANRIMKILSETQNATCVFIVPRLELIKQAHNEFGDVDIIWSDKTSLTGKPIIIASADTLRTQYTKIPKANKLILFFDEVHIGIKSKKKLVDLIKPDRVLGLTATPERMDGLALTKGIDKIHEYGIFDTVMVAETVPSLIEQGYLTPLKYYVKQISGISDMKSDKAGSEEFSGEQMEELFDEHKIWGDLVASYEHYNPDRKPSIGFTVTIEMAQKVCSIFNSAGYDFRVISGEMNVSERDELINALKTGECDGLVNAALLTYGFDCPECYYAFSCRHIKSRPLWFQMVGRILRKAPNKTEAIFVDHGDSISEFAEPNCALPILDPYIKWNFEGVDKEEKKVLKTNRKRASELIKMVNDLDPQPIDMVELTPEDLYSRVIKIHNKVFAENTSLRDMIFNMKKQLAESEQRIKEANLTAAKMVKEKERLAIENSKLKSVSTYATPNHRTSYQAPLPRAQRFVSNSRYGSAYKSTTTNYSTNPSLKKISGNDTFLYIKNNYAKKRHKYSSLPANEAHDRVLREFLADEAKLSFIYDKDTFDRSMNYWKNNYVSRF